MLDLDVTTLFLYKHPFPQGILHFIDSRGHSCFYVLTSCKLRLFLKLLESTMSYKLTYPFLIYKIMVHFIIPHLLNLMAY
jgi:hypothetical protein